MGTRRETARTAPNLLEWTPVRVAEWRDVDGGVVLERPPPKRSGIRGIGRLTSFMAAQRVRLDDIGSFSWTRFDGETTVGEVCGALRERFGESVEPAEERLGRFLHSLRREGFVSYREEGGRWG
ncbi:MAG: PqqD family protein [Gemmatimonadota bacterium]